MAVGLIILTALGFTFLASSRVFQLIEAQARLQENVRFAFERITHDLRMTGFTGCGQSQQRNVLNPPHPWAHNLFGMPLQGHLSGQPPAGVSNALASDMLTVLRADQSQDFVVTQYQVANARFQFGSPHGIRVGTLLVATDCAQATVFQMTGPSDPPELSQAVDIAIGSGDPGNASQDLGFADCGGSGQAACRIRLLRLLAGTFYLARNPQGEPALYRETLGVSAGKAVTTAAEIVDGIERMQLRYGVDSSTVADGSVDAYLPADQVSDWSRVLAVRIALVAVSRQDQAVNREPQPFVFNGETITPNDLRLRKVFQTTIAVRNRA